MTKHPLLLSLTFTGFPANQHVERAHCAKGDLLGQIVDGEGPSVPQHHCLTQQGSGWDELKLLLLQKQNKTRQNLLQSQILLLFCDIIQTDVHPYTSLIILLNDIN